MNRLGGQVIRLSPNSDCRVNPMDISDNYNDEDDPLTLKSDFILSMCELIAGGKTGLEPVEKTIIDRCTRLVYRDYFTNPSSENMPVLEDLYNHRTNVQLNNRVICYDIKDLGKQLKKLGMLILQDRVWGAGYGEPRRQTVHLVLSGRVPFAPERRTDRRLFR